MVLLWSWFNCSCLVHIGCFWVILTVMCLAAEGMWANVSVKDFLKTSIEEIKISGAREDLKTELKQSKC